MRRGASSTLALGSSRTALVRVRAGPARRRYHCSPSDGSKAHSLTLALPREHVHSDTAPCDLCEKLRGAHRGET